MANGINRRCPKCGRQAHDRLLVQCPECHVAFADEPAAGSPSELTPEQLDLVARYVLRSWKFWAVLVLLAAAAAWGVVLAANHVIEARSREYLGQFNQQATNQLGAALGQISNQVAAEFRQPHIKAAIEQAARDHATELFDKRVQPSLDAFQGAMDMVNNQLVRASNTVAQLESEALAAQRRIPPPQPVATAPPAPVATNPPTPPVAATPPASAPPAAAPANGVKLVLVSQNLMPAGSDYLLTLFFKLGNGASNGQVDMIAGTYKQTAKVVNFASLSAGPSAQPVFNDTGDAAELKFNVSDTSPPTVVLEVSAPTIVRLMSDALDSDLTVPIAADKMRLAPASK